MHDLFDLSGQTAIITGGGRDIAACVLYLVGNSGEWVTGQNLVVAGTV